MYFYMHPYNHSILQHFAFLSPPLCTLAWNQENLEWRSEQFEELIGHLSLTYQVSV